MALPPGRFGSIRKVFGQFLESTSRQFKMYPDQGPSGRYFQLRDGSGSGIAKNFGFGYGYGSGTGICTIYLINRVLSGNKNIDQFFSDYINMAFSF